jgi:hypothetical protein
MFAATASVHMGCDGVGTVSGLLRSFFGVLYPTDLRFFAHRFVSYRIGEPSRANDEAHYAHMRDFHRLDLDSESTQSD